MVMFGDVCRGFDSLVGAVVKVCKSVGEQNAEGSSAAVS